MRIAVAGATGLVGRPLVAQARAVGHEVVEIARSRGVDLTAGDEISTALAGVDAVIDVTQSPSLEQQVATEWFTTVAERLGNAARQAGVRRTVALSIVGVDRTPDFGYYVAKLAHEDATRSNAPGPVIVRATQFHEFAGLLLDWGRDGDQAAVLDFPSQPIAVDEVARTLLDRVTATEVDTQDIAGPQQERTLDQARRLLDHRGEAHVAVEAAPTSAAMQAGSALPGLDALRLGPTYDSWLAGAY
jgi:uncharacterized protein YbjT (DUF2867 family)